MALPTWRAKVARVLLIGALSAGQGYLAKDLAISGQVMHLNLRTRVRPFKTNTEWQEVNLEGDFQTGETALIICDMWDNHWCTGAARRVDILAQKMAAIIDVAR